MIDYPTVAQSLSQALRLDFPPIAVCLTNSLPEGMTGDQVPTVPAGCVFWQEAAQGPIVTTPKDHELCSVGMYTHNMATTVSQDAERNDTLSLFAKLGYLRPEDIPTIPVLEIRPEHIIYSPLSQTPIKPNVVLLFARASQALILSEAAQAIDPGAPPAMGRPTCAIIAQVANSGKAAVSLGCCGARAYLDNFSPDIMLFGIPGIRLTEYVRQVEILSHANSVLTTYHQIRRNDVKAGKHPSVRDSLRSLATAT